DWRSSELELSADARVAEHEGTICGYAVVRRSGSLGLVAPDHEGRGIGSRLLARAEEGERERATPPPRQRVVAGNDRGQTLLLASGYTLIHSYYHMNRSLHGLGEPSHPPDGVTLRALDVDADALELHALDAASFKDAADYDPMSADAFREDHLERLDLDREL